MSEVENVLRILVEVSFGFDAEERLGLEDEVRGSS